MELFGQAISEFTAAEFMDMDKYNALDWWTQQMKMRQITNVFMGDSTVINVQIAHFSLSQVRNVAVTCLTVNPNSWGQYGPP